MNDIRQYQNAVDVIKTAILQSQARATKAVNQEQLALYFGIGRFISVNTRNKNWGTGALKQISNSLKLELPGLRGFSETNLKNMRLFYEAWKHIESNSSVATDELCGALSQCVYLRILNDEDRRSHEEAPLGLILCKDADKDYAGYIMQDFRQPMGVATYRTADEMDPEVLKALPPKEELIRLLQDNRTDNLIKISKPKT